MKGADGRGVCELRREGRHVITCNDKAPRRRSPTTRNRSALRRFARGSQDQLWQLGVIVKTPPALLCALDELEDHVGRCRSSPHARANGRDAPAAGGLARSSNRHACPETLRPQLRWPGRAGHAPRCHRSCSSSRKRDRIASFILLVGLRICHVSAHSDQCLH